MRLRTSSPFRLLLSSLAASAVVAVTATSLAEVPHVEAHVEPAVHAPTPMNPAKLPEFRQSRATGPIPHVSEKTIALAQEHDVLAADPSRPIPAALRIAKHEVLERDARIGQQRGEFKAVNHTLESRAAKLANPLLQKWNGDTHRVETAPRPATSKELTEAAEVYVVAAQMNGVKYANYNQRAMNTQSDLKSAATKQEVKAGLSEASRLYSKAADTMDKAAIQLTADGKPSDASAAADKAHKMRTVATRYEHRAASILTQ